MSSHSSPIKGSYKELRAKCKSLGLGEGGSKAELLKRLNAQITATATTSDDLESGDPDLCDCIVATEVEYGGEDEMRADAAVVLGAELEQGLEVETLADGQVAVGNRRGIDMAEVKTKVSELMEFKEEAKSELASAKSKIASLEDRVQSLSQSLQNYKLVRGRFVSTFKRDVLGTATDADRHIIRGGKMWAHGGDAIVDAQLYEGPGGRRDLAAYIKLYGVNPLWVQNIGEFFAIHQS